MQTGKVLKWKQKVKLPVLNSSVCIWPIYRWNITRLSCYFGYKKPTVSRSLELGSPTKNVQVFQIEIDET